MRLCVQLPVMGGTVQGPESWYHHKRQPISVEELRGATSRVEAALFITLL